MNPKGRQAKSKARLSNYDKMLSEGGLEKEARLIIPIPNGPRLGNKVIEGVHLTKAFGDKLLYEDLNFDLPPAGIVGIIGPNGAGKTTTLRMILGLLQPTSGDAEVEGFLVSRHPDEIKRRVGLVSTSAGLYQWLTPREILSFFADVYGVPHQEATERIAKLSRLFEITSF